MLPGFSVAPDQVRRVRLARRGTFEIEEHNEGYGALPFGLQEAQRMFVSEYSSSPDEFTLS